MATYFAFNTFVMVFFCTLLPVSAFAISSIPLINCLWTQFPYAKNKATSVAVVSFATGGALWNFLFTKFVNPHNETTTVLDKASGMAFFSEDVSSRVVACLRIGFIICGGLFVIGSFLIKRNLNYFDHESSRPSSKSKGE